MLPTFCPPTIWAISLEFYRKLSILAADDFLGACFRRAMTPKKLWTLLFPQQKLKTLRWRLLRWRLTLSEKSLPGVCGRPLRTVLVYVDLGLPTLLPYSKLTSVATLVAWYKCQNSQNAQKCLRESAKGVFGPPE